MTDDLLKTPTPGKDYARVLFPGGDLADAAASSPRLSFKGWLFSVWLAKNKAWVKAPLVLFFAWLTWAIAPVASDEARAVLTALVTVVGRLAVDAFDYYVTEGPR